MAEIIVQKRKNHTVGDLILPACQIIVGKMLSQNVAQEIQKVPLTDNTIS